MIVLQHTVQLAILCILMKIKAAVVEKRIAPFTAFVCPQIKDTCTNNGVNKSTCINSSVIPLD